MAQRMAYDRDFAGTVEAAAELVKAGGVVIFPTETFYGIAANPADPLALQRLASIKDRSAAKPVPMIAADSADCQRLGTIAPQLQRLCDAFWPGPLTIAIPPAAHWSPILLGTGKTLGVRVSSHPFARALARAAGGLITSTSANPAAKPPADSVQAIDVILADQVDLIVDGGTLREGKPSTVVYAHGDDVVILRDGSITHEQIEQVLGRAPIIA